MFNIYWQKFQMLQRRPSLLTPNVNDDAFQTNFKTTILSLQGYQNS